jgi:hypothetical protein
MARGVTTMNSYMIYQMVQAEQATQRARCTAAQRQADAQLGELAAAVAQYFGGLARPAAAVRAALRRGLRGEAVTEQ